MPNRDFGSDQIILSMDEETNHGRAGIVMEENRTFTILTIDDEEAIRGSFRAFLEDYGYIVFEAENGKIGLEVFKRVKPDLITVDLRMPVLDGLGVMAEIRKISPETPIIVISGTGVIGDAIEALHLGAWDYMLKPIEDLSLLLHSVERGLEHARLERANREHQEHLQEEVAKRTKELNRANEDLLQINTQLKASEQKFRTLTETSPVAIMMYQDGRCVYSNHATESITGYKLDELLFMNFLDIVHQDYFEFMEKSLRDVENGKMPYSRFEFKIINKDDEERWVDLSGGITELDDRPASILSIVDITEKRKADDVLKDINKELEGRVDARTRELQNANDELQKAKEEADTATRAKSSFLANMSHEIRTPMNGVIAAADLALNENIQPKVRRFLKIIHSSGYSLLGVINDILDFSKIEADKLDLEIKPFQLEDVLANAVAIFVNRTVEQKIELLVDIEPETTQALMGDQYRIQQLLTNLLSNAFKFTKEQGTITVGVEGSESKEDPELVELKFFLKDTGIGMTQKQQDRLFQPFSQADSSTTRKYGGTGLGLSICRKLTEMMEGRIWVESEIDKGTTFYFTLALKRQPQVQNSKLVPPRDLMNLRILVVDDNADSRILIRKILTYYGFKVETVSSGREALNKLKKSPNNGGDYDLILMDWVMPNLNGIETMKSIRNDLRRGTPVILMTSFGKETELRASEKTKINGFLSKPFHTSSLFIAIMDVFGKADLFESRSGIDIDTFSSLYKDAIQGMNILVVEDNPTNQDITRAVLETAGVSVQIAENGRKAVAAVRNADFDAVLMDIQMPEMDGFEATQSIRGNPEFADLPIIAMTAHAMKGDEEKCLATGMNAYISKPINQDRLFQTLCRILRPEVVPIPIKDLKTSRPQKPVETKAGFLEDLQGIDVQAALSQLKLEPATYQRILRGFLKNNLNFMEKMWEVFYEDSAMEIVQLAHNIKGSAANIGAVEVHRTAQILETAGMEFETQPVDRNSLKKLIEELETALNPVLESIQSCTGTAEAILGKGEEKVDEVGDLACLLKEFVSALDQSSPKKIGNGLLEIKKVHNGSMVRKIENAIENYDYDKALDLLKKMATDLDINLN